MWHHKRLSEPTCGTQRYTDSTPRGPNWPVGERRKFLGSKPSLSPPSPELEGVAIERGSSGEGLSAGWVRLPRDLLRSYGSVQPWLTCLTVLPFLLTLAALGVLIPNKELNVNPHLMFVLWEAKVRIFLCI